MRADERQEEEAEKGLFKTNAVKRGYGVLGKMAELESRRTRLVRYRSSRRQGKCINILFQLPAHAGILLAPAQPRAHLFGQIMP